MMKDHSEHLPEREPLSALVPIDSLINNPGTGSFAKPFDESDDIKSNSLHGFA